jgi:ubiquinone/menaquinone biosynthesis C-methylase UbiE
MKASSPARHTVRERDEQCHHSRGRSGRPPRRAGAVDRLARVYDVWAAFAESKARRCAFERADVTGHDDILEVAVGTGQMFAALAQANTKGTTRGIDVSPGMLTKVRRRTGGLDRRVELQLAEARALPFDDRSFDLVVVGYLFDLLPETDFGLVFAEINRVLRDSGRVVVVDMTNAERRRDDLCRWVSRLRPRLLGGCRGVRLAACLASGGFDIEHRDYIAQCGFPSEVLLARRDQRFEPTSSEETT